jgi:hypothetical protein
LDTHAPCHPIYNFYKKNWGQKGWGETIANAINLKQLDITCNNNKTM